MGLRLHRSFEGENAARRPPALGCKRLLVLKLSTSDVKWRVLDGLTLSGRRRVHKTAFYHCASAAILGIAIDTK